MRDVSFTRERLETIKSMKEKIIDPVKKLEAENKIGKSLEDLSLTEWAELEGYLAKTNGWDKNIYLKVIQSCYVGDSSKFGYMLWKFMTKVKYWFLLKRMLIKDQEIILAYARQQIMWAALVLGFKIPYKSIPCHINSTVDIAKGVLNYRLEKGF